MKWLVIPALVAVLGYFVVGPQIGATKLAPAPPEKELTATEKAQLELEAENKSNLLQTPEDGPQVKIDADDEPAVKARTSTKRKKRRTPRSESAVRPEVQPEQSDPAPPVDEGGSGGAATAGGG